MSEYNRFSRYSDDQESRYRQRGNSRSRDGQSRDSSRNESQTYRTTGSMRRVGENDSTRRSVSFDGTGSNRRVSSSPDTTGSSRRVYNTDSFSRMDGTGSQRRVNNTDSFRRMDGTGAQRRINNTSSFSRMDGTGSQRRVSDNRGNSEQRERYSGSSRNSRYGDQRYSRSGGRGYSRSDYNDSVPSQEVNNDKQTRKEKRGASDVVGTIGSYASKGASAVSHGLVNVAKRSKVALVAIVLVALIVVFGAFDGLTSIGKIHGHVVVGDVKAKGMTKDELAQTLQNTYGKRLDAGDITVYASEEAMAQKAENPVDNGDLSVEEAAEQTVSWKVDKDLLQASIDYNALADEAFEAGRNGFFDRLGLFFFKKKIPVEVNYNEAGLENLASTIDLTLGSSFVNSEVTVEDGKATASESKDGMMIDREEFKAKLTECFTNNDATDRAFVETAVETPAQISTEKGQAAADKINAAIAHGANFSYEGDSWSVNSVTLGSWIGSYVITDDKGEHQLSVYFDPKKAQQDISEHAKAKFTDGDETVSFEDQGDGRIVVLLGSEGTMPQITSSISSLNDSLFGDEANTDSTPSVTIESAEVPQEMEFNEALNSGVITLIQEYTTEYTLGAEERNHNIQLAADMLNNSIVKANGGEWSFHGTIGGECNEELGFKPAGSIVNGELVDEEGGGICQTSTTVFNAVYEAGLPVTSRRSHSIYISSYEPGRDAAVSWPDLDLKWENDTTSDILLKTSHTDTTVSVYLYGVDPGYTVETDTGQWEEGSEYDTVYEYDSELAPGSSYVKTTGSNGKSITVIRTVYDKTGEQIREDTFESVYDPVSEVIVRGGTAEDFA